MKLFILRIRLFIFLSTIIFTVQPAFPQQAAGVSPAGENLFSQLRYRNVGPTRGGRVTAVEGVAARPGSFYMGASGGGVWKTTDYGQSWRNLSDGYFSTPSVGAICVDQGNPDVVYVGTGSDGLRSNVITGKGIYKTTDGGRSWTFLGLEKVGQIGAVEIHPEDPQTIFVAAIGQAFQPNRERGVYRSQDGGATWDRVFYHSDTVGVVDLEFAPGQPNTIYAALWRAERKPWTIISGSTEGGIYKSMDGGDTWNKLSEGLPQGLIGKIDLAVSPEDPSRVYALVEAPEGEGGLYRSDDYGATFYLVTTKKELINRPFYYCNIEANPRNANTVFVMANRYMRSYDSGKTWTNLGSPHGDNHDLWIHPGDTLTMVQCNDGGANVSTDYGRTWSTQSNQPTAELYQVEVDDQFPYWLYAGQQDNSTIAVPGLPPYPSPAGTNAYWLAVGGCETGPAVPKPGNHNIVYSNCKGRFGVYDKRTGQERHYYVGAANIYSHNPRNLKYRFQRVAPIHVSPHNPDVVYHGSQYLHKTVDDGVTWETISPDLTAFEEDKQVISGMPITRDITGEEYYSTIYSIRESPIREGLIYVGANDGPVHVTTDGGTTWKNVTPDGMPGGGRVDCVEPSPHKEGKAYIAVLRYQLGDWHPYMYKTEDYGSSWILITPGDNGLPSDFPTRVIREDPEREGLLYAGTEFGMFVSLDDGLSWSRFQQNLPVTPVTDIKVYRGDLVLSTMGRSFWILDDITLLRQIGSVAQGAEERLFKPRDTFRMRYRSTGEHSVPFYPPATVNVDYNTGKGFKGKVTLEFLNSDGETVRKFEGIQADDAGQMNQQQDVATGFSRPMPVPALDSEPGMHRFRWDMRHPGAWDKNERLRYHSGPLAAPGKYTVRLTLGEQIHTGQFSIIMDPNVAASGITLSDLREQESLALKVCDIQDSAKRFASEVREERSSLDAQFKNGKAGKKSKMADKRLKRVEEQLFTAEGPYMKPMLLDQINYLNSMLNRADQRPGKDAYLRYEELKQQLYEVKQLFRAH